MSIKLIIISRYNSTTYIDNVKSYFPSLTGSNLDVIVPTETEYETTLLASALDTTTGNYNLVIYDWSFSQNTSPSDVVNSIIGSSTLFDLMYLGKYLDTCSKYTIEYNVSSAPSINVVKGTEPIGFNAILLTGDFAGKVQIFINNNVGKYYSLNYVFNDMMIAEEYISYALSPNLFVYNPMYSSIDTSQTYSVKTTECEPTNSQINPPSDNSLMIFWIILIIAVICLVIYLIVNFTSFGQRKKKQMILENF
jgi:hypothetical protein